MAKLGYPSVDVMNDSNEQNIASLRSYLYGLADELNYELNQITARLDVIEQAVSEENGEE